MTDANELAAAVDRLRRCESEGWMKAYHERPPFGHPFQQMADWQIVVRAYLALGTRQPDETRVFADGRLWNIDTIDDLFREDYPDARVVRVTAFIREVE